MNTDQNESESSSGYQAVIILPMIVRQGISSNKENLDYLHNQRPWIPSSVSIRPLPEIIAKKFHDLQDINSKWYSMEDYLNYRIFGLAYSIDQETGKFVARPNPFLEKQTTLLKKLVRNEYPYQDLACLHSILWYNVHNNPYITENQTNVSNLISNDIENELKRILPPYLHESFQFVWYENPKMSVPHYYHVHVFWIAQDE